MTSEVLPKMVRRTGRDEPYVVLNTGSIRFDIFKGPFTRNDQVSPGLIEGNKRERNKTDMGSSSYSSSGSSCPLVRSPSYFRVDPGSDITPSARKLTRAQTRMSRSQPTPSCTCRPYRARSPRNCCGTSTSSASTACWQQQRALPPRGKETRPLRCRWRERLPELQTPRGSNTRTAARSSAR